MGSTPKWVFAAQHADQLLNLFRHRRAARFPMANLPAPEQAKALTLPANHRGGLDDGNARFPTVPDRGQPRPETAVRGGQFGALDRALQDTDLMAQGEDLQLEGDAGPK